MKAKPYPTRNCWRVTLPARFSDTGKERSLYFKTEEEANAEIERIIHYNHGALPVFVDRFSKVLEIIEARIFDIKTIKIQANGDLIIEFDHKNGDAE